MTDTIDKLVFSLDGDLAPLQGKFAQADAEASRAGKSISQNFAKPITDGVKESGQAAETAAQGWGRWAGSVEQTAPALKNASAAAQEADKATKSLHGSTATATREFRALFDELSSGRTRQSPGTLAIIATRVFGISGATLAWSAALAAIPVGLAVAAFQAESSLNKIDEALKRTGDQAGVTVDQIRRIAESGIPGLSVNGAQGVLGILAGRANIAPNQLANVARAVPGFARATGTDSDKAAEELEKLLADPAKGAQQLNEEFKLLDVSTTRQIEDLEAAGRTAEAQALLVKGLNDRFDGLAKSSWSLAAIFEKVGAGISTFWTHTGQVLSGNGQTGIQRGNALFEQQAAIDLNLRQHGVSGIEGARSLIAKDPHNAELGVGDQALGNLVKAYDAAATELRAITLKISADNKAAEEGRAHSVANSQVGFGLKIADEYDDQGQKAKKLGEQLSALNLALNSAVGPNAKYREEILRERDAVALALKNQRSPAQIAADEAADQRRVAAAPAAQRETLRAQLAARRELERNLSDPKTAPYAQSIYQSQMGVAALNNKDVDKQGNEAERMRKNLAAVQAQADGERDLALAWEQGAAAADKAKAVEEAHTALVRKETSDENAYAAALQKRAFWQAAAANAQNLDKLRLSNAGLAGEINANGNPAALANAKREAEINSQMAAEFAAASTPEALAKAQKDRADLAAQLTTRDTSTAVISGQASIYNAQTNLRNIQQQASIFSPDALRQLQVMQETMDSLVKTGLDPASDDFKKLYNQLLPFNLQISDLSEKLQQARQAASDFASDITGPLEQFLEKGGSIRQMFADVFANIGKTTIHDFLIQPAQKMLTSGIGSLLGVNLSAPDGSLANPYYVMMAPQGAILNAAGGGLSSIVSNITGGSSGGGIFGSIFGGIGSFIGSLFGGGKASGGYVDPGKFYVVGENGPEILSSVGGNITPLSAPKTSAGDGGGMPVSSHMTYNITVAGTGDKELLQQMHTVASQTVESGIQKNNAVLNRTQRGNLIKNSKRALV